MNEPIKYKWLPSEPTDEMFSIACKTYDEHSVMDYVEPEAMQAALNAYWKSAPEVEREPVGEVISTYEGGSPLVELKNFKKLEKGTKLYTHPQPKREPCTVTRHEVREAMMYCEINYCEGPDAYTLDILKRLGIGVE
jgi:hypothetical protein